MVLWGINNRHVNQIWRYHRDRSEVINLIKYSYVHTYAWRFTNDNLPTEALGSVGSTAGSSWPSSTPEPSPSPASTPTSADAADAEAEPPFTLGATEHTPYQCQFCDKAFPRLSYLKKHEQVCTWRHTYFCYLLRLTNASHPTLAIFIKVCDIYSQKI